MASVLTPCLDHSNHPRAEIISTIAEKAFGKLKANFALKVESHSLGIEALFGIS